MRGTWALTVYFVLGIAVFILAAAAAAAYVFVQTDRDSRRSAENDARFATT